jgi:hypothetical protein
MNAFDTLKVKFDKDLLHYTRKNQLRFDRSERTVSDTGAVSTKFTLPKDELKPCMGLGELSYDSNGGATITLSAKALGRDYVRGITTDTIEQAITNALPEWITVDTNAFVESADVMRADVTENVPCEDVERVLVAMEQWQHDTKRYHPTLHGRGRVTGVVWQSILKTDNTRMIAYDKVRELQTPSLRAKANVLGIKNFEGTVRVELNVRSFKSMRELFSLGKGVPRLTEILQSKEQVLYKGYNMVLPQRDKVVTMANSGTFSEFRSRIAYEHIFEVCQWDWKAIEHTIRARYAKGSNPYRRLSEARDYYQILSKARDRVRTGEVEQVRAYLRGV